MALSTMHHANGSIQSSGAAFRTQETIMNSQTTSRTASHTAHETRRMLVAVAHPDDETFGCGSLIAHAARQGIEVVVACATRGEGGSLAPGRTLDGGDLADIREQELRDAARLLGAASVRLLGWVDSGMDGEPLPTTLCATPVEEVANRLAAILDEFRPHIVVTLDGSDGHRDHIHLRDATLAAVDSAAWQVDSVYLHCLPQALMRQWVDELRRVQPDAPYLGLGELGTPPDAITTVIDTGALLAVREEAIAVHSSQTSPYEQMSASLRREFLSAERLMRVRPVWTDGAIETELGPGTT
jgi:LmbE family N-acetylglucosaminyl deacetylase